MCYTEDDEEIYQRTQRWKEESRPPERANRLTYVYETPAPIHVSTSIRQNVKVHHHAPMQARAILALLLALVVGYLLYIVWPYRVFVFALLLSLAILASLLLLARYLVLPLIRQIQATRPARLVHQEQEQPEIMPMYDYRR